MRNVTPEQLMKTVAANVKRRRIELHLSQCQLSRASGLAQPNISALENGKYAPRLQTLADLASALSIAPSQLLSTEVAT